MPVAILRVPVVAGAYRLCFLKLRGDWTVFVQPSSLIFPSLTRQFAIARQNHRPGQRPEYRTMETIRSLHPLRITQLSTSFRRECEEYRRATFDYRFRAKRTDGAEAIVQPTKVAFRHWDGMTFNQLQGLISRKLRDDQQVRLFVNFWDGPRQIFQFENRLAEMLAATEVGDVPWDSLHFPYPEFYLHFGCVLENTLDIAGRVYKAEGAYVRVQSCASFVPGFLPGAIHISVATRLISPDYQEVLNTMGNGSSFQEPTYDVTISGQPEETVAQALVRGREAKLELARRHDEDALHSAAEMASQYGIDPVGVTKAENLGLEERKFLRGEAITTDALKLVFNCIAYLSAVPVDSNPDYPPEAPQSLVEKIKTAATPKKERKFTSHMQSLGFTKVHFIRNPSPGPALESVATGKSPRAHWRRGHWRSQPCGSGLVKRSLIWIRPCIVNPEKDNRSQITIGHIYKVNEEQIQEE